MLIFVQLGNSRTSTLHNNEMDILIRNGEIFLQGRKLYGDILIEGDKIKRIEESISLSENIQTLDACGKMIIPGGIDPHVHMALPSPAGNSSDDFFSGSKAALAGGTTSFIDFVTPQRGESFIEAYKTRKKLAEKSLVNTRFHVSPTWWGNDSERELEILVKEHGVSSFKCYMAYQDSIGINDEILKKVFEVAAKLDLVVAVHCEDFKFLEKQKNHLIQEGKLSHNYFPDSRPRQAEIEAVKKAIELSAITKCKLYIVHVSTKESVEIIRIAQRKGIEVYAEICPQYLLLYDSVYNQSFEKAAPYIMSPPLRKKEDNEALWEALSDGTIQTVGTDHCPFNLVGQKDLGKNNFTKIPNGAGGIEYRLNLLYTYGVKKNRITMARFIELTSSNPANIFNFKNKGQIKEGYDADLVIWDPEYKSEISKNTHIQNCDSNIYEGIKTLGKAETVILKGEICN